MRPTTPASSLPYGDPRRVLQRAEAAAESVRWNLGLTGAVSAFEIAQRLNVPVTLDRQIPPRGFVSHSRRCIWLRDGELGVRMEHTLGHELGHLHIPDNDRGELTERACDRFSVALLLPPGEFAESVRDVGLDPTALQKVWRFSSLEAITRRIGEVVPGVSSTAWLELNTKWREGKAPAQLVRRELEALGDAYHRARGVGIVECEAGVVRVWRTGSAPRAAVGVLQTA